jgi:hypothetical protein
LDPLADPAGSPDLQGYRVAVVAVALPGAEHAHGVAELPVDAVVDTRCSVSHGRVLDEVVTPVESLGGLALGERDNVPISRRTESRNEPSAPHSRCVCDQKVVSSPHELRVNTDDTQEMAADPAANAAFLEISRSSTGTGRPRRPASRKWPPSLTPDLSVRHKNPTGH